jgi:hypothetical protein
MTVVIPYERQEDLASGRRLCGAAALRMVYRSFGADCTQSEIWEGLVSQAPLGTRKGRTYLLAQDALGRGFQALVLQASQPERILRRCQESGCRVILNHRLQTTSGAGHYSVLVGVSETEVVLHDPQVGPSRRLGLAAFLELWRPCRFASEITGQVLVAIGQGERGFGNCSVCGTSAPSTAECPRCGRPLVLRPTAALGCVAAACPERMWRRIFCPWCDASLQQVAGLLSDRQCPGA